MRLHLHHFLGERHHVVLYLRYFDQPLHGLHHISTVTDGPRHTQHGWKEEELADASHTIINKTNKNNNHNTIPCEILSIKEKYYQLTL